MVDGLGDDLQNVVIVPFCRPESEIDLNSSNQNIDQTEKDNTIQKASSAKEMFMSQFLALGENVSERDELVYQQLPFDHPLFIMYSSGTTGKPKCIVIINN